MILVYLWPNSQGPWFQDFLTQAVIKPKPVFITQPPELTASGGMAAGHEEFKSPSL